MPAMNFRREFGAISGLSVVLVVASALVLGVVMAGWTRLTGIVLSGAELVDVRQWYRPRRDAMMDRDENVHELTSSTFPLFNFSTWH